MTDTPPARTTFPVQARRHDKQWVLTAHTENQVVTALAPSLADAKQIAEEAIALATDLTPHQVVADISYDLGDPLTMQLIGWRAAETIAVEARSEAQAKHVELAAAMLDTMSTADASAILGLSRQRLNELAREHRETSPQP